MAWSKGFRQVELEFDSQVLINKILNPYYEDMLDSSLMLRCKELINRGWQIWVIHTFREGNEAIEWLANQTMQRDLGLTIHHLPPLDLIPILLGDAMGVFTP